MKAQSAHLLEMAELSYATMQILPFSAGAHPAMISSFKMLRFPEELKMNAVYVENERGAVFQERRGDLQRFMEIFEQLTELALSPIETKELVVSLTKNL
ncbi:hypothetical protein BKA25_002925 [Actinoalloteichus hymeniacidonis]|uniref:DUF5753 domain-containing protein n=1 Tax=Actinoalloteichus hymeniacidonis TaxID=340345 RepID=A0AAC9HQY2_9PSEU|nr:hypothetical protein TL08_12685 [Actinoalloteichus hymeniacidonis]MBB5908609.1 hypothetical protein [Actinoalloteichus hymeniacidonis]